MRSVSAACTLASVLCLLSSVFGAEARAQSGRATLSGFVTDAATGERLAGANLYAADDEAGATANGAGFYTLTLPARPDTLRLHVSFVGYRTDVLALVLAESRRLDVALAPASAETGEVEVVAARGEDIVASTRMSTVALSAAEVERMPAFLGEPDPIKAIQLLPGVQSGAEGQTGLYVRGGGPDQNLLLLDGAPLYNVSHVLGFLSVFNAAAVGRVELTTGGFPARYGGRLSSVVDVALREGDRTRHGVEGSVGVVAATLAAEGPLPGSGGRGAYLVAARRTYVDVLARPFLRGRTGGQELTSYFYDLNARLTLDPTPRDRLALSAYLGDDVYGTAYTTRDTTGIASSERFEGGATWGNALTTLRWTRPVSERLFATAALTASRYRFVTSTRIAHTAAAPPDGQTPAETFEQVVYASGIHDLAARGDLEWSPSAAHAVRVGAGLTRHAFDPGVGTLTSRRVDSSAVLPLTPETFAFTTREGFVYAENDVRFSARLQANIGLHASAMRVGRRTYASLQPRLAARLLLTDDWSAKASFSTMEQYLHLLTTTGINLPTDLWVAPTERIGPQRAWQAAVGTAARLGGWTLSVEGYYKDMRGLIEYRPGASFVTPGEGWEDKVEAGRGWAYGGELLLRRTHGRTTGWLGYTLSWSRRRFAVVNDGAVFPYRYDRRHDLEFVLHHRFSDRLDAGLTWVYGTGQAVTLATARFFENGLLDPRQLVLLDPNHTGGAPEPPTLLEFGPRGGYRMAPYHRLDLALNWHFGGALFLRGGESTLSVGAYNTYSRRNPFFLFAAPGPNGGRVYKQASLFPILPAVAYRFSF